MELRGGMLAGHSRRVADLARDLVTREGMLLLAADHSLEAQTIARIQHFLSSGAFEDFKVYVHPSVESVD
jgi:hypothetical protein